MKNALEQVMGVQEAGELWGLSADRVKGLCQQSKITCKKVGKTWVIDKNQENPKGEKREMTLNPKELYIFSNEPVAPLDTLIEKGAVRSDYARLSAYLHESIAFAPNYFPFADHQQKGETELNFYKRMIKESELEYDFVHVYRIEKSEYNPIKDNDETFTYKWSHKEFNTEDKRKRA